MEIRQTEGKAAGGENEADDGEVNTDMKLFGKKRPANSMHSKGFGGKSFAKKK